MPGPRSPLIPFTTLHPQIGIVEYPDLHRLRTLCDVPGLIERRAPATSASVTGRFHAATNRAVQSSGAAVGYGRHGWSRAPWDDFRALLRELELYDPGLLHRPRLVVANKMDEPAAEENLKKFKRRVRKPAPFCPSPLPSTKASRKFKLTIRNAVAQAADAIQLT